MKINMYIKYDLTGESDLFSYNNCNKVKMGDIC